MKIPQMDKPKVFWGSLLAADAVLVVLFGWALYGRIAAPRAFSPETSPPSPQEALPREIEKDAEKMIENAVQDAEKSAAKADETIANRSASSSARSPWEGKPKAQKVVVEYRNKRAKNVSVAFSFAGYKPRPMKKSNGGLWVREEYLTPGNYRYHFIVDGKETPDPANPRRKGKNSVLPVE